jgi:hypothetical protein
LAPASAVDAKRATTRTVSAIRTRMRLRFMRSPC